ncbi:MAG: hypothetical protein RL385_15 [Pseudomonadota bacterium]|jgi:hypothetical protein
MPHEPPTSRPLLANFACLLVVACIDDSAPPCPPGMSFQGPRCMAISDDAGALGAEDTRANSPEGAKETTPSATSQEDASSIPHLSGDAGSQPDAAARSAPDASADAAPAPGCRSDADCGDPNAPVCGAGSTCTAGCTQDAQCARTGLTNWTTNVCATDHGGCVQCMPGSPAEAAQCTNGNACTVEARTCTGKLRGTVGLCLDCTSDSECAPGHACVSTDFQGHATGSQCLPLRDPLAACTAATPWTPIKTLTVNGRSADVCGLTVTTCSAFNDVGSRCITPSNCGHADLHDGHCVQQLCTYACVIPSECMSGICVAGYCQ